MISLMTIEIKEWDIPFQSGVVDTMAIVFQQAPVFLRICLALRCMDLKMCSVVQVNWVLPMEFVDSFQRCIEHGVMDVPPDSQCLLLRLKPHMWMCVPYRCMRRISNRPPSNSIQIDGHGDVSVEFEHGQSIAGDAWRPESGLLATSTKFIQAEAL
jgi:hypothetical protein